jgi:hypothetical protein
MILVGTYAVPANATPVQISVDLRGSRATVALGRGHASSTDVHVTLRGTRIRFTVPGGLVFDGTTRGGTVRHGNVRGRFTLRPGVSKVLQLFGLYRSAGGDVVTVNQATGFAPWLVELPSGSVHGIGAKLTVGERLGDTSGNGMLAVDRSGNGARALLEATRGCDQRHLQAAFRRASRVEARMSMVITSSSFGVRLLNCPSCE